MLLRCSWYILMKLKGACCYPTEGTAVGTRRLEISASIQDFDCLTLDSECFGFPSVKLV